MLIYKELKLLGTGHLQRQGHPMCVGLGKSEVVGGRVVIGSSLLIQACAESTACPWPGAAGSYCIPRVIYCPKGQASRYFSFPLSVLPRLTLFTVSPLDMHRLEQIARSFHPLYLIGISQKSCELIMIGVVDPFY